MTNGSGSGNFDSSQYVDGRYNFTCRVKDNDEFADMDNSNYWFYIDNTKPITTDNSDNQWHATNQTITLVATDLGSDVNYTKYCVDENNTCEPNTLGTSVLVSCAETQCQNMLDIIL